MDGQSDRTNEYANHEYFCRLFQRDLASLYQLAFLLTANHEKAQSVFVAGIDECTGGNPVFKQWARSWARRVIIAGAIHLIEPVPCESDHSYIEDEAHLRRDLPEHAVARLSTFNRFVFIMSVLERIPDLECATLLGCRTADVVEARIRALQAIALAELREHETARGNAAIAPLEVA
jgi:hypothetical protein